VKLPAPPRMIRLGAIGTIVTAVCCFTPALAIVLGALGAAGAVAYLDPVLIPLLGLSVLVLIVGLVRRERAGR
jgi:mercuric ion transport protein